VVAESHDPAVDPTTLLMWEHRTPLRAPGEMSSDELRAEVEWWRHWLTKVAHDSEMPKPGDPLFGSQYSVTKST